MNIGVPTEIKAQETRVGMVPGSVAELVKRGHRVFVQQGAGDGASYTEEQYRAAGAEILPGANDIFSAAELIVKVKEPQLNEASMLDPRYLIFTYLHLAANKPLTTALLASGCTAIAYETIEVNLADLLPRVDLVIGAVLVPGARAPKLITREMLRLMPRGSVFVDIAVDQGGCAETTHPTTHDDPTYEEEEVLHYCVANMPGAYSRTATQALNNVTQPWILLIAEKGLAGACAARKELIGGINIQRGKVTCKPVAEAHALPFSPAEF